MWATSQVAAVSLLSGIGGAALAWRLCRASARLVASKEKDATTVASVFLGDGKTTLHPQWAPGTPQPCPLDDGAEPSFLSTSPAKLKQPYFFSISAVVPRPIALVGSLSSDGVANVAPFSYFGLMGHDPLCLAFTCCVTKRTRPAPHYKDTLANIKATGECTVQIMSTWFVESANYSCGNWEADEDEFDISGLTKIASHVVKPPRVKESAVQFECQVLELRDMVNDDGELGGVMVLVKVVMVHINKKVYNAERGTVDLDKLAPISRLGGNIYGQTKEAFELRRPGSAGAEREAAMKRAMAS